jgi:putative transposase
MSAITNIHLPVLCINDVLKWNDAYFRVIDVYPPVAMLFELDKKSGYPQPFDLEELEMSLIEGEITILEDHKYTLLPLDLCSREKAFKETEERYNVIKPIVEHPEYLDSGVRGKLVRKQIEAGYKKPNIYRLLRTYWTYGQTIESMATQLHKCGAPGKLRTLKDKKPGPASKYGIKVVAIRTVEIVQLMNRIISIFYFSQNRSVPYAYRRFVSLCKGKPYELTDEQIPSRESFRNVIERHYSLYIIVRNRTDPLVYLKDIKPLSGSATASVIGPGATYELDATVIDIWIVCESDRSKVLGKPILYLIVCTFSRKICGYYIGWYSPSFRTATLALLNAVQDKTHLLKKYNIAEEVCAEWPAVGLPSTLLCDKAELFGLKGTHLCGNTRITVSNTPSGLASAKGVVERHFPIVQKPFEGDIAGKSSTLSKATSKKSGAKDGRLTFSITSEELQAIIIAEIVIHNNCHPMKGYDCEADMPDTMPLIPINVWDWGIKMRMGVQRKVDLEALKVWVLPQDKASASARGVTFKGMLYYSEQLEALDWFLRIKNNRERPSSVSVLYDPMLVDQIFVIVHGKNSLPIPCYLKEHSRAFLGCTFDEAKYRLSVKRAVAKEYGAIDEEFVRQTEENTIKIFENANAEKKKLAKKSIAQVKGEIKQNRHEAREQEKIGLIAEYSPSQQMLSLPQDSFETQDEFTNPELDAIFNLQDKDVKNETTGNDDEYED